MPNATSRSPSNLYYRSDYVLSSVLIMVLCCMVFVLRSFNAGPMHFTGIDTETWIDTADVDKPQQRWINEDLASMLCVLCSLFVLCLLRLLLVFNHIVCRAVANAQRAQRPWVVAFGHRPLYCSNKNKMNCEDFASHLRVCDLCSCLCVILHNS